MSAKLTKGERHRQDLSGLFDGFLAGGDAGELEAYIVANSNLPGRRGNLELAAAFGDDVQDLAGKPQVAERLWALCVGLAQVPAGEAPVNDPRELIPFCGTVGLGAIGSISPAFCQPSLAALRPLAGDPRWRMREAVCFGLQRLMASHRGETLAALEEWVSGGDLLEMRAAAATVAEPALLQDESTANAALALHTQIIDQVCRVQDRKSEAFRVLRKGLGYTLSLVVYALPEQGFAFMARLLETQDPDLQWIVKENLKKNRLVKNYPEQVGALQALL
jgi:hypothetical protein